jgi:gamma-glutamyl phosphate reductase
MLTNRTACVNCWRISERISDLTVKSMEIAKQARAASILLQSTSLVTRNNILLELQRQLEQQRDRILDANRTDIEVRRLHRTRIGLIKKI